MLAFLDFRGQNYFGLPVTSGFDLSPEGMSFGDSIVHPGGPSFIAARPDGLVMTVWQDNSFTDQGFGALIFTNIITKYAVQ